MFNTENSFREIISRFPIEMGKGYWIISVGFMIVSATKLFQGYKVQSVDERIPWKKLIKVSIFDLLKLSQSF